MGERKLARVVRIDDIRTHDNADALELAYIGGWQVVIKKGEFQAGDLAVYLEIDSWVPHELAPFLSKGAVPRTYNDVPGERLKTIKLRGEVSQGLLLKISDALEGMGYEEVCGASDGVIRAVKKQPRQNVLIEDLDAFFGIQKWEKPVSAEMAGQVRGSFPTELCEKTDAERVQNCWKTVSKDDEVLWHITEKLDGSSMTVIFEDTENVRVCSRNQELKVNDENKGNTFVKLALELREKLAGKRGFVLQGELIGPGIQGNKYKLTEHKFYVFRGNTIAGRCPLDHWTIHRLCVEHGLDMVPYLGSAPMSSFESASDLLHYAEGKSELNPKTEREGLVFSRLDYDWERHMFKAISNKWLIKNDG